MGVQFPFPTPKEKNMAILDIIKILQEEGHSVQYYHRKDGGYVITRIDGQRFSGKSGNIRARTMTGQALSQARSVQLARIRLPKGKKAVKQEPLPDEIIKEMKRVQRAWRKNHPDISGTISTRGVRYQLQHYGKEQSLLALDKAYRYTQGYAYIDNVNWLIARIENDLSKRPNSAMESIVEKIQQKALSFKEEWISNVYEVVYEWEKGVIDGDECARRIESIIS